MTPLAPCRSCDRHVRRTERACPFCGAAIALDMPPVRVITERLGRAAIFSIGAAAITQAMGCGGKTELAIGAAPQVDAAMLDAGAPHTHYGGPPRVDAGDDGGVHSIVQPHDAGHDTGGVFAAYGGPELPQDAGDVDTGCSNADYGAPPCR